MPGHQEHNMSLPPHKISSATELNWTAARAAAQRIADLCNDAGFAAPEDTDTHIARVRDVCDQIYAIVAALKIRARAPGDGS
jgi:hypothetical protein